MSRADIFLFHEAVFCLVLFYSLPNPTQRVALVAIQYLGEGPRISWDDDMQHACANLLGCFSYNLYPSVPFSVFISDRRINSIG